MEIVLGPPGTGKTTRLLQIVLEALERGVEPQRIGFFAFTRKAALEARERAETQFSLRSQDLPYFRTLHSLAFKQLGVTKDQVMTTHNYQDFGRRMGIQIRGYWDLQEGSVFGNGKGDRLIFLENLSRIHQRTIKEQYIDDDDGLDWWEVERVHRGLAKYKEVQKVIDFTDMIARFQPHHAPELDLLIIDECQDLSKLQWHMVHCLVDKAKRTVIAGDDDQAIFRWAGADVGHFIRMQGEVTTLNHSYRVPKSIQSLAHTIISRVQDRRPKEWAPREADGSVENHSKFVGIDMNKGSWLVLVRNDYLLEPVVDYCRREGFAYLHKGKSSIKNNHIRAIQLWERLRAGETLSSEEITKVTAYLSGVSTKQIEEGRWYKMEDLVSLGQLDTSIWHQALDKISAYDRAYLLSVVKKKEPRVNPRITLSTIHGAKGGEAENVVLFTDMATRSYKEMHKRYMEDEARVFYVGVTRAKENLHVIQPQSPKGYFIGT